MGVQVSDPHQAHGGTENGHGYTVLMHDRDFAGANALSRHHHCLRHGVGARRIACLDLLQPPAHQRGLDHMDRHFRQFFAHARGHHAAFFVELSIIHGPVGP